MDYVPIAQIKPKRKLKQKKMLQPSLTNCVECTTIPALINDIDCKIKEIAGNLYNNVIYALNQPVPGEAMIDLMNYRRILTYKFCNPDYAKSYTIKMIASRVKLLKYK